MKLLISTIICLTIAMNSHMETSNTLEQSFEVGQHISRLLPDLEGKVKIKRWYRSEIRVETSLESNVNSEFGLEYTSGRGHYELSSSFTDAYTIAIQSKKINTEIYIKGKQHQAEQTHTIYVPVHLEVINND